jgi:hypothetical protein
MSEMKKCLHFFMNEWRREQRDCYLALSAKKNNDHLIVIFLAELMSESMMGMLGGVLLPHRAR